MKISGDWDIFDIQKSTLVNSSWHGTPSYDRLVAMDGAKVIPYLAQSWVVRPGQITFTLRTDAKCTDGSAVTADVVTKSLQRFFHADTKAPYASNFVPGPFTVTADDATHVTVKTGSPYTDLLPLFNAPALGIVCPAGLANPAGMQDVPQGSGPYTIASAIHNDKLTFKLRPDWKWGPRGVTSSTPGLPETLVLQVVPNLTTSANLLVTGAMNLALIVGPDSARLRKEAASGISQITTTAIYTQMMIYNHAPTSPTSDVNLRKAISTAVDPAAWNIASNLGYGTVSKSILGPTHPCYDASVSDGIAAPSLDQAKAILQSSGYTLDGGKLMKGGKQVALALTLQQSDGPGGDYLVTVLQSLGIAPMLDQGTSATWNAANAAGKFDITSVRFTPTLPPLSAGMDLFTGPPPPNGRNWGRIDTAQVAEKALADARIAAEGQQCVGWNAFAKALVTDYHIKPLAAPTNDWHVKGIEVQPSNPYIDFTTIRAKL